MSGKHAKGARINPDTSRLIHPARETLTMGAFISRAEIRAVFEQIMKELGGLR